MCEGTLPYCNAVISASCMLTFFHSGTGNAWMSCSHWRSTNHSIKTSNVWQYVVLSPPPSLSLIFGKFSLLRAQINALANLCTKSGSKLEKQANTIFNLFHSNFRRYAVEVFDNPAQYRVRKVTVLGERLHILSCT